MWSVNCHIWQVCRARRSFHLHSGNVWPIRCGGGGRRARRPRACRGRGDDPLLFKRLAPHLLTIASRPLAITSFETIRETRAISLTDTSQLVRSPLIHPLQATPHTNYVAPSDTRKRWRRYRLAMANIAHHFSILAPVWSHANLARNEWGP
jgi:hypothetical protein